MPKKPLKIVLTGGPSGGKSTTIKRIQQTLPHVYCAPEVATLLLSGGYPAPNAEYPWSYKWQKTFQKAVAATQIALEQECERRAMAINAKAIVYDRGLIDGASYLNNGIAGLKNITQLSEKCMLDRYDFVLHLPSFATKGLDKYDKKSNKHRFEEAKQALQLEYRVRDAWKNHKNRHIAENNDPLVIIKELTTT